uniref:Protein kinase domain-containing protein n=1 Tax=Schistocephalus solidus TaxID=70667 RepID=A0A0X3P5L2_SCHSO
MRGPCPMGTFHTLETIQEGSRLAPYTEAFTTVVPVCRSCHRLCSRCSGYSQMRSNKTTPGCQECNGYWFEDKCVEECPEEATFQVSLVEDLTLLGGFSSPKAQLSRHGLLLRGPNKPRQSVLWTRHVDGVCLACSKQCRKGCWGPSNKQCNQCVHVRVWRLRQEQSENPLGIWTAPSGRSYKLNVNHTEKDEVGERGGTGSRGSKSFTVDFECLPSCPESLPFRVFDPLTGEQTCYASAPNQHDPESHPVARGSHGNQPKQGLFLGVGAIVFLILLSVIFVCAVLACAPRVFRPGSTQKAPWFSILRRFVDKLSRVCRRCQLVKTATSYVAATAAPMAPCDQVHYRCCRCEHCQVVCEACAGAYCATCSQACPEHFAKPAESEVVFRNTYYHSPVFRRATRQPNMGRLIMINSDDIVLADNPSPLGSGAFGAVYQGVWRMPEEAERLSSAIDSQRSSNSLEPVASAGNLDVAGGTTISTRPRVSVPANRKLVSVAVKILNENSGPSNLQALLEEAKVMVSVSHPNCLRLLGVCLSGTRRCLVSEYIANGSLDCYLRRHKGGLSNRLLLLWAAQIADGMAYLEATGIIHRDLATRNVLVKRQDLVQITDFGLAKMLSGDEEHGEVIVQSGRVPIRWLAVETLTSGRYSFKTDVWAYGVTLWELFTFGERPYANIDTADVKRYVLEGGRLMQPDICTLDAYQLLLLSCWRENPEARSSFIELLHLLQSRVGNPEFFLHDRHTSSLMGSSSAAESNDQVATFSSRRLSDLPAPQSMFQKDNRSSCPQATGTSGGTCNPRILRQATEQLPRRPFCSTAGARNNNSHVDGGSGGCTSNRRRSQLLRRRDLALNTNNHASVRSLSGTEEGDQRNWQTLSTSIGSSSGVGNSSDTCAVNTNKTGDGSRELRREDAAGQSGAEVGSDESQQVGTLVEAPAGQTDNEVTLEVGGYVWPRWPLDFDRETRFGWNQHGEAVDHGREASRNEVVSEELPNLSRLVLQRRSQRERLEYQRMIEEASPTTMIPETVALMGEYIEPAPRYYVNPSDQ